MIFSALKINSEHLYSSIFYDLLIKPVPLLLVNFDLYASRLQRLFSSAPAVYQQLIAIWQMSSQMFSSFSLK